MLHFALFYDPTDLILVDILHERSRYNAPLYSLINGGCRSLVVLVVCLVKPSVSIRCVQEPYIKPCSNENASRRKFELASRLNTNLRWLALTCVDLRWLALTLNTLKFLRNLRRLAVNLRVLAIRLNGTNASYRKLPQVNLRWLAFSFERGLRFRCPSFLICMYE
jgi:hypothetical protein